MGIENSYEGKDDGNGDNKVGGDLETVSDQASTLELIDETAWKSIKEANSTDERGLEIILFAERWARLMQAEVAKGKKIEEVAEATEREADTDNISGAMLKQAVRLLVQHWKYGEELHSWDKAQEAKDRPSLWRRIVGQE